MLLQSKKSLASWNWLLFLQYIPSVKPVLSKPRIKQTPPFKWTPPWVLEFSSYIYTDTSVKQTQTPILTHFVAQNLYR